MALSKESLKVKLEGELKAQGFVLDGRVRYGMGGWQKPLQKRWLNEITQNAQVPVTGGSSAGTYKVT